MSRIGKKPITLPKGVKYTVQSNIVIFRIDSITGALTPTGEIAEVPAPVCMIFVAEP